MTKTCPDATVLSTSQPDRMDFDGAMDIVERGFKAWKDKPHNAKWFKRIDGTPIPNDLTVNIAEAIVAALAAAPAVGGDPDAWEWRACIGGKWGAWLYLDQPVGYFKGRNAFNLDNGTYELRPLYAAPLRGREPDEWELAKFLCEKLALEDFDKISHTKYLGDAKAVLEFLSASSPEQPASQPAGERLTLWGQIAAIYEGADDMDAAWVDREWLKVRGLTVAQPASPLQARESVREIAHRHCTCTCRGDPEILQNHTNLCDEISDAILEYAVLFSAAPEQPAALPLAVRLRDESGPPLPQMIAQRRAQLSQEQPAAAPDVVKMCADMERAKNARIGELEEALGKAVLSAPAVRQLTENERDAIAHAKYQCDCSSPSDPEVRFDYEVIRTLLSLILPKEVT